MEIMKNKHGHVLEYIGYLDSIDALIENQEIDGTNAILLYKGNLLLCWNNYRNNWELPGGGKEKGENLIDCVIREIYEETSQTVIDLQASCLYRVFIPRINREITGVTFYKELNELTKFISNEEINKIILWDMESYIGDMDEIDMKIVEFVMDKIKGESIDG